MCLVIIFWDYQTKNKNGKYELIICHSYFNHPIGLVTRIDIKQAIYEALLNINSLNHIPHHLSSEVPKRCHKNKINIILKSWAIIHMTTQDLIIISFRII